MSKASNTQIGGSHYKDYAIQPYEFITRNNLGFLEGCVIKRMCRWQAKGGVEDLRKAIHEIELLIEAQQGAKTDAERDIMVEQVLEATGPVPAANPNLPAMGTLPQGPYPTKAPNGTRLLTWRPRGQGLDGSQLYGWVEIGFMWDGQLVPHEAPR